MVYDDDDRETGLRGQGSGNAAWLEAKLEDKRNGVQSGLARGAAAATQQHFIAESLAPRRAPWLLLPLLMTGLSLCLLQNFFFLSCTLTCFSVLRLMHCL
jgi:hypothetical protein